MIRHTGGAEWGRPCSEGLVYFLISPHNPVRCYHFSTFRPGSGVPFPRPHSKQVVSWDLNPRPALVPALYLPPHSSHRKSKMYRKIILAFITCFFSFFSDACYFILFHPQTAGQTCYIHWFPDLLGPKLLFEKYCHVLLPKYLLLPPPPQRPSPSLGSPSLLT